MGAIAALGAEVAGRGARGAQVGSAEMAARVTRQVAAVLVGQGPQVDWGDEAAMGAAAGATAVAADLVVPARLPAMAPGEVSPAPVG